MFVKCEIKTILEKPLMFIFNMDSFVLLEKNRDEPKINFHLSNGAFEFIFESEEIMDEVYRAFIAVLKDEDSIYSSNISLLILR